MRPELDECDRKLRRGDDCVGREAAAASAMALIVSALCVAVVCLFQARVLRR
jgi:hypothetical protein